MSGASATLGTDSSAWWTMHRGESPLVGTAIHNGHGLPAGLAAYSVISEEGRLREEDPFTEFAIRDMPNRIVVHQSRFAVDLNRPRNQAIYLKPEQSWGVEVFAPPPSPELVARVLRMHDQYYEALRTFLGQLVEQFGRFVVLDIHSYNHRRDGRAASATSIELAPEINIGTFSMDRARWAHVVDPFIERLREFQFRGKQMDVRENVAFQGRGEQTRFIHSAFPRSGCAIAVEFKKFFMDEWTGEPDREALDAIRAMLGSTVPLLEEILVGSA
jgi:N-formylglutamate amidohydrolase